MLPSFFQVSHEVTERIAFDSAPFPTQQLRCRCFTDQFEDGFLRPSELLHQRVYLTAWVVLHVRHEALQVVFLLRFFLQLEQIAVRAAQFQGPVGIADNDGLWYLTETVVTVCLVRFDRINFFFFVKSRHQ